MNKEVIVDNYGKDKLKNIAEYEKNKYYPIIHKWVDCHVTSPNRKFIIYFAIPDDKGNVFVIPCKWCSDLRYNSEFEKKFKSGYTLAINLNDAAKEQLNKAGKFKDDPLYLIEDVWESKNPNTEDGKTKFDVYFSILDDNKNLFIVQSNWGSLEVLDDTLLPLYNIGIHNSTRNN